MKISRKMKKIFVTFLTATLSIIMFVTSTSATNIVSYSEYFEHEGVVDAIESMGWYQTRNRFSFGVDLECYECDNVDYVYAKLELTVTYPSSPTDEEYSDVTFGYYTPDNTWDSDELSITVSNFDRDYEIVNVLADITYEIHYDNGVIEQYVYTYNAVAYDGEIYYFREEDVHTYFFPIGE